MPSVSTPAYPSVTLSVTLLPPLVERTPEIVMQQIEAWPHWYEIKRIALKEYGMEPEKFDTLLPEYQRFLGLIMLGHRSLGMFSFDVDKVWHSHVLASHLWAQFCMDYHGRMINHVPQVPLPENEMPAICIACTSCRNCNAKCKSEDDVELKEKPRGESAKDFATAYLAAFHQPPPAIWDLKEAEGCATD